MRRADSRERATLALGSLVALLLGCSSRTAFGIVMRKPDNLELGIRFGCGFSAGIVLAALVLLRMYFVEGFTLVLGILALGAICGFLAARWGDDFWYSLKNWWF